MIVKCPSQKTSMNEKETAKWYIPTIDYMIEKAISLNNKTETKRNLDAANNIIDSKTYKYVLNPLSGYDDGLKSLPGEIRNVDFITPILEKNIGEYIVLPYHAQVTINNADVVLLRSRKLKEEMTTKMKAAFVSMVESTQQLAEQQQSQNPQQQVQAPQMPDFVEYATNYIKEYVDERAIQGQHRLNLLNNLIDFDNKRISGFFYWWATEEFYTHRWIENGDIRHAVINPLEGYPIDNGEEFVEDMDGFLWRRRITYSQFWDDYRNEVRKEDIPLIEAMFDKYNSGDEATTPTQIFNLRYVNDGLNDYESNSEFVRYDWTLYVDKINWKTQKPIKLLRYYNALGEEIETEVPVDYKLDIENGDISATIEWVSTFMTAYRFGNKTSGVYTIPKEDIVQRCEESNPSRVKGSFGGKRGLINGKYINPIPRRLLPYMALYRIYTLQQEREIAKHKGNIQLIPQSMINSDDAGTSKEKMFYMLADNKLVYDDTQVTTQEANAFRIVSNPGLEEYIRVLNEIRKGLVEEAWDLANMNRDRFGGTQASQTNGNANRNVQMAALGSTLMVQMYNKTLERDHMADLEYSKLAWINGKTGSYWNGKENKYEYISVDGEEHNENQYGIFVRNSLIEDNKLQQYKDLAFSASQNGDFEMAAGVLASDNIPSITKLVAKASEERRKYESGMEESKNASIKYAADLTAANIDKQIASNEKIAEAKNATTIEVASMNADAMVLSIGDDGGVEDTKLLDQLHKDRVHGDTMSFKERELAIKERIANTNARLKEKDINNKLKIAKENKNQYNK